MACTSDNDENATTLSLRAAFYAGLGSNEEEMDVNIVDYLISVLADADVEEEDAWGALQGYLPDNVVVGEEAVGALRQALKDITNAKEMQEEAAAVWRREAARAAAVAAASGSDGSVRKGEEGEAEGKEEEDDDEEEEVLTEAQLLDLAFLHDLLGEGGVEEEEERVGKRAAAATMGKNSSLSSSCLSSSSSSSSTAAVAFPRELIRYVYQAKCGKTRQRAAEVLVTSASEEGIASLREEQERYIESRALARATRLREALRLKQQIVDRFADQVTIHDGSSSTTSFSSSSSSSSSSSAGKRVPISIPAPPAGSKLRFRDGVVVASKGEKYLIEKITPDWDGGSRGKIKTKGKRGPGFV